MSHISAVQSKLRALQTLIHSYGKVAVALSGGVDSSLVLKVAIEQLGENAIAIHAHTPLQPLSDLEHVKSVCDQIGSNLEVVDINPLIWPEFVENPANRCYLCKKKIYSHFLSRLSSNYSGFQLVDGTNGDDLQDDRPGLLALDELSVKKPLAEVGLSKEEIRSLSRELQLSTWDRPTGSCLATRINSNLPVTTERLNFIETSEEYLAQLGFIGTRVRVDSKNVLIEFQKKDVERGFNVEIISKIIKYFRLRNVRKVYVDVEGR